MEGRGASRPAQAEAPVHRSSSMGQLWSGKRDAAYYGRFSRGHMYKGWDGLVRKGMVRLISGAVHLGKADDEGGCVSI